MILLKLNTIFLLVICASVSGDEEDHWSKGSTGKGAQKFLQLYKAPEPTVGENPGMQPLVMVLKGSIKKEEGSCAHCSWENVLKTCKSVMTMYCTRDENGVCVKGDPGPPGAPGVRGIPGAEGRRGKQGHDGENGEIGAPGDRGLTGDKGDKGPIGLPGSQGPKGESGGKGQKGPRGGQGRRGEKGWNGARGRDGLQGYRGYIGPKGDAGVRGPMGLPGPPGPNMIIQNCATNARDEDEEENESLPIIISSE